MPLVIGTRLGPYEIQQLLGAGGMGEVYQANDTRLNRSVAIKVLPPHVASDPELRLRFEREARTIAALNHPHICVLYDVGHQDGTDYLVMEQLAGETLADRLKKGPLPVDQALRFSIQIADALDKAHRQGIVHRDLKPANIMLTSSGIKLLDFGLAKLQAPAVVPGWSQAPTKPAELTARGTILGTIQYMAPEQIEGHEADARSDIFALGVVLYEMVTGRKAFEGKSQASLMAAILDREPSPMSVLQPLSPPALEPVVQGCLAKTPDDRWQTAHDVMKQLQWIATGGSQVGVVAPPRPQRRGAWGWIAVSVAALLMAMTAGLLYLRGPEDVAQSRFLITTPEMPSPAFLSVSPDGRRIAFVARNTSGSFSLFLRALDSVEAQPLAGTENAIMPFWSPDSRNIGFGAQGKLKRIDVAGGLPQSVCDAPAFAGGTWNADGVIVFSSFPGPLNRVPASGGEPRAVTAVDTARQEQAHVYPFFLPDGRHVLFWTVAVGREGAIDVASLDSKERVTVLKGQSNVAYVPPGYLVFHRNGTLMSQPFDSKRLSLSAEPVRIADGLAFSQQLGLADFAVSNTGVLLYRTGAVGAQSRLTWYDRAGKSLGSVGMPAEYRGIALSPDGKRIAVHQHQNPTGGDIWVLDQERGTYTRLTFTPSHNLEPVWSRDGQMVAFASDRDGGVFNLYQKSASGAGNDDLLLKSEDIKYPSEWAPDGKSMLYAYVSSGQVDVAVLPLIGDRKPKPFLNSEFAEAHPKFSPDGRWVAYASNESGRYEVYVQPYPERTGKWQISTGGGSYPRWARSGKEMFYMTAEGVLMAVDVHAEAPAFNAGAPRMLFSTRALFEDHNGGGLHYTYDVSTDGMRFLINERATPANQATPLTLVLNWQASLKK
jgi:Tol biopolymer transport system component